MHKLLMLFNTMNICFSNYLITFFDTHMVGGTYGLYFIITLLHIELRLKNCVQQLHANNNACHLFNLCGLNPFLSLFINSPDNKCLHVNKSIYTHNHFE